MASSSSGPRHERDVNGLRTVAVDRGVVGTAGALLAAAATVLGPFVVLRPNRVLPGVAVRALAVGGGRGWWLLGGWLVLAALSAGGVLAARARARSFARWGRWAAVARGLGASALAAAALEAAGARAASFAALEGPLARTSLGGSFYVMLFGAYLVLFSAAGPGEARLGKTVAWIAPLVATGGLLVSGRLSQLAVLREYANIREAFWGAFGQHVMYTAGATGVAVVLGVLLGVWSARRRRAESAVFGVLNVAQVLPTLAFIGLLMPLMSWMGENVAVARAAGVGGIGWAPVFVVLVAYALYPITRNVYSAIRGLDSGVVDAAKGMGMNSRQRLWSVELPLALPVVLAGVRIALVQTTAGAIIAALVGGGGLGRIVFYGLEQTAEDLVLVGVLPIVALGLSLDIAVRGLEGILASAGSDAQDAQGKAAA
ncbi:MAG: ABC transporter permease [Coriobacteriales bacterium]|nr:ABC transporter permease [Actinomycetes bacterium]